MMRSCAHATLTHSESGTLGMQDGTPFALPHRKDFHTIFGYTGVLVASQGREREELLR